MSDFVLVSSLSAGVSLLLLLVLCSLFRDYRTDSVRDELFALRDSMFLYAGEQGLLESVAHIHLRLLMNGMIRYAHQISFFRLIALYQAKKIARVQQVYPEAYKDWLVAISKLPVAQRERLREFHTAAMLLVMKHMILGSPFLLSASILVAACLAVRHQTKMLADATAKAMSDHVPPLGLFEAEAYQSALSA